MNTPLRGYNLSSPGVCESVMCEMKTVGLFCDFFFCQYVLFSISWERTRKYVCLLVNRVAIERERGKKKAEKNMSINVTVSVTSGILSVLIYLAKPHWDTSPFISLLA